jgi:hypothetical protein
MRVESIQQEEKLNRAALHAEAIRGLQELGSKQEAVAIPVMHLVSVGVYARVAHMKAGTIGIGRIHKKRNSWTLISGIIRMTDGSSDVKEYHAPCMGSTEVGTQRVIYAVTDAKFMSFHRTEHSDLSSIEAELITDNMEEL